MRAMLFGRLASTAAALALGLGTLGCQPRIGPFHPESVTPPVRRVIPLRMLVLVHCEDCAECRRSCREGPSEQALRDSVHAANEVFAPAGIHFERASIKRVETPHFWSADAPPVPRTWAEVRDEARRMFPWIPADAWPPNEIKTTTLWHAVLAATYSRPREITVFVQAGAQHAVTAFPDQGRGVWASDGSFGRAGTPMLYLLAHELGHYFGLRHTFAHGGVHPARGSAIRLSDRWDLVYRPGSGAQDPHRFFSSRAEVAPYADKDLQLIEQPTSHGSNCHEERDGSLTCALAGHNGYSETHRSGDPALRGLSFPLSPGESRYFRFGRNVTDYGAMAIPRRLSPSQLDLVRQSLQRPLMISRPVLKLFGRLPQGIDALPSYRTTLGLGPGG